MKLEYYKIIFIAVGLIGILLVASPALSEFFTLPMGQPFSEIYVLSSDRLLGNLPFNVTVGTSYSVYAGVGNQRTSSNYYVVYVKFRNETGPLPNSTSGAPSPLQSLYEYRFFLQESKSWEAILNFSISDATISGNQSLINKLNVNGVAFDVNTPSAWNTVKKGFCYQIFLELWVYNAESNSVIFDDRFVGLQLNFTKTA